MGGENGAILNILKWRVPGKALRIKKPEFLTLFCHQLAKDFEFLWAPIPSAVEQRVNQDALSKDHFTSPKIIIIWNHGLTMVHSASSGHFVRMRSLKQKPSPTRMTNATAGNLRSNYADWGHLDLWFLVNSPSKGFRPIHLCWRKDGGRAREINLTRQTLLFICLAGTKWEFGSEIGSRASSRVYPCCYCCTLSQY